MNKKGQIPEGLLFLAMLILIAYAVFVMVVGSGDFDDNSRELASLLSENNFQEEYFEGLIYLSFNRAIDESRGSDFIGEFEESLKDIIGKRFSISGETVGNFHGKIRNKQYEINENVFSMKGVFLKAEVGNNELISKFDLEVEFDETGVKKVRKLYK